MPLNLPVEAYRFTERSREWAKTALPGTQYGLGGTAYAKTRKLKEVTDEAKAWQDANTVPPEAGGIVVSQVETYIVSTNNSL